MHMNDVPEYVEEGIREVQVVGSCPLCVLGTRLRSSARAV